MERDLASCCGLFAMTIVQPALSLPDHTQLPESDGTFVFAQRLPWSQNFQEHPQSILLTTSIQPTLDTLHPGGQYAIGQDCGIYWRLTDPPIVYQTSEYPTEGLYLQNIDTCPCRRGSRRQGSVNPFKGEDCSAGVNPFA